LALYSDFHSDFTQAAAKSMAIAHIYIGIVENVGRSLGSVFPPLSGGIAVPSRDNPILNNSQVGENGSAGEDSQLKTERASA
jgi:hypothetical protein